MYCSICGGAVAPGLIYCNHCGARLSWAKGNETRQSELFPESLIWAIVSVFVVGLGCIIGLMAVMKNVLDFNDGLIAGIILLSFALIFIIEGVFIWLLLSRRGRGTPKEAAAEPKQLNELVTKELYTPPAHALSEPSVPSVVEHTTRTLEPVYSEKKQNKD